MPAACSVNLGQRTCVYKHSKQLVSALTTATPPRVQNSTKIPGDKMEDPGIFLHLIEQDSSKRAIWNPRASNIEASKPLDQCATL